MRANGPDNGLADKRAIEIDAHERRTSVVVAGCSNFNGHFFARPQWRTRDDHSESGHEKKGGRFLEGEQAGEELSGVHGPSA